MNERIQSLYSVPELHHCLNLWKRKLFVAKERIFRIRAEKKQAFTVIVNSCPEGSAAAEVILLVQGLLLG